MFLDALASGVGGGGSVAPSAGSEHPVSPVSHLLPEVLDFISHSGEGARARGIFVDAGSRLGVLNRLARPVLGPGLLLTQSGRSVLFDVTFQNRVAPDGKVELFTERVIRFGSRPERFVDALRLGSEPGTLLNYLGERRTVEIELACGVNSSGEFVMRSRRAWLRFAGLRLRLPRLLGVDARSVDGFDAATGRHTIDVSVRNPLIGTVLRYRGSYTLL